MTMRRKQYKVSNGAVQLAVSETGQGQTLLFFNGGGATQVSWKRLIGELGGPYRLVTFDFRNHGKTTTSHNTSFESFLTDAEAMMDKVALDRPILVGWSLGADLAVWYAASHPGKVAGLFLIDGALPVNLVSDPEDVRRRLNTLVMRIGPLLLMASWWGATRPSVPKARAPLAGQYPSASFQGAGKACAIARRVCPTMPAWRSERCPVR